MIDSIASAQKRSVPFASAAVAVVAALGCGVLAARPALLAFTPDATAALVALFCALLAVGVLIPLPRAADSAARGMMSTPGALMLGALAFVAGRLIVGGYAPTRLALPVVLANSLAAVAEEVWFRRICFGLLAPAGPAVAVAGSTVLFAAVHVAVYGFWVVPVDLAVGAVLGWQRVTTGSWAAPAATHVLANLLVLL